MSPQLPPLPIDGHLDALAAALGRGRCAVLTAPPGSGKTTRVPPALLDAGLAPGKVLMLQPRRVAARACAARIAFERGTPLGAEVGYRVRGERAVSAGTRIEIVTQGLLLRQLQHDPFLEEVGVVILDEFHERSLELDLALALLREVTAGARGDLKLLVMSATLAPGAICAYLGGCPLVEVQQRPHPVAIHYASSESNAPLAPRLAAGVRLAFQKKAAEGDILAFLPGLAEIRRSQELLADWATSQGVQLLVLHGGLTLGQQAEVLAPGEQRRVILATNVAETSLTLPGITSVVDGGQVRMLRYDPRAAIDRLRTESISKASADQRAGRAGRLGPGSAYRLWTAHEQVSRAEQTSAEIRRVDLCGAVLELRAWGGDPHRFDFFEQPPPGALRAADALLLQLGALDAGLRITALGRSLLELPLHPRLGRVVLEGARQDVTVSACAAAALLEQRDLFAGVPPEQRPAHDTECELCEQLELLDEWLVPNAHPRPSASQQATAAAIRRTTRELCSALGQRTAAQPRLAPRSAAAAAALGQALLAGFSDRVVARSGESSRGRMVGGLGVDLSTSGLRQARLALGLRLGGGRDSRLHLATRVDSSWLELHETRESSFDEAREQLVERHALCYRDLALRESLHPPDRQHSGPLLAAALARDPLRALAPDAAARQLLARLGLLRRVLPELGLVPEQELLVQVATPLAAGKIGYAELRQIKLGEAIQAELSPQQRHSLKVDAPSQLRVPSGRELPLLYPEEGEGPPVLAVKLQELFGARETPRIARGRVPVLLQLLAPNRQPVQTTQDLASFWSTTYSEIRKDLRARYPKHPWPSEPDAALPTHLTQRQLQRQQANSPGHPEPAPGKKPRRPK